MIRLMAGVLAVVMGAGIQDQNQAAGLVKKLDSADWVEQAQAAKDLAKLGPPVVSALRPAVMSDSPSMKYWASVITEFVMQKSVPPPSLPLPVDPESVSVTNPKGFAPGPSDMGSLVFVCNNPRHEPFEATFSRCTSCAKTKRFAYDYGADCYRCAVCKRGYDRKDVTCEKCGQPPAARIPIRMKTAGGM